MVELTKIDARQSFSKIRPTDKMVMMPGLFDHQNNIMRDLICI